MQKSWPDEFASGFFPPVPTAPAFRRTKRSPVFVSSWEVQDRGSAALATARHNSADSNIVPSRTPSLQIYQTLADATFTLSSNPSVKPSGDHHRLCWPTVSSFHGLPHAISRGLHVMFEIFFSFLWYIQRAPYTFLEGLWHCSDCFTDRSTFGEDEDPCLRLLPVRTSRHSTFLFELSSTEGRGEKGERKKGKEKKQKVGFVPVREGRIWRRWFWWYLAVWQTGSFQLFFRE